MSHRKRFVPFIVFCVFGGLLYLLALWVEDGGSDLAQNCARTQLCGVAQERFTNAILFALFGTTLILIGGFITLLTGQQDRQPPTGMPLQQHYAPPPPRPGIPWTGPAQGDAPPPPHPGQP